MVDMEYWLGKKYDILAKQAEGQYQKDISEAKSLPGMREAYGFHARAVGQQALESAATTAADRYATPFERGFVYDNDPRIQRSPGTPGTGAPAAGTTGAGTPPPIQFQTLPGQPGQPAVSPTAADASQPPDILTSPELIADMPPEELAQWTKTAATPQGVQGPAAPAGAAARQRLAAAQARQPSLQRPTSVTTSRTTSPVSPLYSTDFRRGTANVKRQGLKKGAADVKPRGYQEGSEDIPRATPSPTPMGGPSSAPPTSAVGESAPATYSTPRGQLTAEDLKWIDRYNQPGYQPGAGVEFLSRPEQGYFNKIAQAVEKYQEPSLNVEDRRDESFLSKGLRQAGEIASQTLQGFGRMGQELYHTVVPQTPQTPTEAAPGSMAAQAGYNDLGGSQPAAPAAPAAPAPSPESLRKGTANVKGKGNGKGKGSKAGPPKGLEALLPMLMAMQGGGGGDPPAGPPPAQGLKKGSANVKGKGSKSKGDQPAGLEEMLPALLAAARGGGAVGPQAADALPVPMAPGAAAPPGFALGIGDVQMVPPAVPPLMPMALSPSGRSYAQGTIDVDRNPGYPFGAGYLFGATAVPGQGAGTVDTVPAMLAPHEAVLNRAAADMLGRGLIAALNTRGVNQMGMRRGVAT